MSASSSIWSEWRTVHFPERVTMMRSCTGEEAERGTCALHGCSCQGGAGAEDASAELSTADAGPHAGRCKHSQGRG